MAKHIHKCIQETTKSEDGIAKRLDNIRFDREWFAEQFGKRPKRGLSEISNDLQTAKRSVAYHEKELLEIEVYLAKEDAALKSYVNTVYRLKKI